MKGNDYLIKLISKYLDLFGTSYRISELQLILKSDPSFPSALSIIKTLMYFGVTTKAYKAKLEDIQKNINPSIIQIIEDDKPKFVILKEVTSESVVYIDISSNDDVEISKDIFCKKWTGIIMTSDKNPDLKINYPTSRKYVINHLLMPFLVIVIAFLFAITIVPQRINNITTTYIVVLIINIIGIYTTSVIMEHEANRFAPISHNICNIGRYINCDKVITSKASKIFDKIPLSYMGFVYFTTKVFVVILSFLSGQTLSTTAILFLLSVCSIPYIMFSFFYQSFIIKSWCPLCITVMILLIIEILSVTIIPKDLLYFGLKRYIEVDTFDVKIFLLSLCIGVLLLFVFKRIIFFKTALTSNEIKNLKLKRQTISSCDTFFNKRKDNSIKSAMSIGNKKAPILIKTIINPLCKPCKQISLEIIRIMNQYPNRFLWEICFDGVYDDININVAHLRIIELCDNQNADYLKLNIIKDWFAMQSLDSFSKKHPVKHISENSISILKEQLKTLEKSDIKHIPTIFLNDFEFKQEYFEVSDIPFLFIDIQPYKAQQI